MEADGFRRCLTERFLGFDFFLGSELSGLWRRRVLLGHLGSARSGAWRSQSWEPRRQVELPGISVVAPAVPVSSVVAGDVAAPAPPPPPNPPAVFSPAPPREKHSHPETPEEEKRPNKIVVQMPPALGPLEKNPGEDALLAPPPQQQPGDAPPPQQQQLLQPEKAFGPGASSVAAALGGASAVASPPNYPKGGGPSSSQGCSCQGCCTESQAFTTLNAFLISGLVPPTIIAIPKGENERLMLKGVVAAPAAAPIEQPDAPNIRGLSEQMQRLSLHQEGKGGAESEGGERIVHPVGAEGKGSEGIVHPQAVGAEGEREGEGGAEGEVGEGVVQEKEVGGFVVHVEEMDQFLLYVAITPSATLPPIRNASSNNAPRFVSPYPAGIKALAVSDHIFKEQFTVEEKKKKAGKKGKKQGDEVVMMAIIVDVDLASTTDAVSSTVCSFTGQDGGKSRGGRKRRGVAQGDEALCNDQGSKFQPEKMGLGNAELSAEEKESNEKLTVNFLQGTVIKKPTFTLDQLINGEAVEVAPGKPFHPTQPIVGASSRTNQASAKNAGLGGAAGGGRGYEKVKGVLGELGVSVGKEVGAAVAPIVNLLTPLIQALGAQGGGAGGGLRRGVPPSVGTVPLSA
uniref:Uncharacterized protein n=1 Tax=Chromera velia CCMP2878 TaxID=1169474 RepID=A0A0G4F8I3_9ALVE|eukprot:Cvel_15766.t1-p1 / transcript=Cvel_15766.t1 / gene=Cvel_15766 / organism=Chromera_velia_CCMP2878 / gene_product=hypothetical protein / transcript_product=hypothetical protein / location=Cvel_scaffold1181:47920-54121(-) / protein_length=625 / sequence_SO=supercontig / SO=protein_coding / is_pseudo=false